jgi:hypothetical protein
MNLIIQRSLAFLFVAAMATSVRAIDLYVATGGSDSNPGTLEKPFATPGRAQAEVRKINAKRPEGRYKGRLFTFAITRSDEETSSAGGMDCSAEVVSVLRLVRCAAAD